ncbi:unnamed protein product [Prunus armeniaca]|uniref:Uncharacterized protein n=1 Tax=Prunus armeniaca TaxID=36596 RepID=A0A6J5U982_PRUAR|nr:unnamed protein product [Prunus armeniaca]
MQKTSPTRADQLKASNLFTFPEKIRDYLVFSLRVGLLLCFLASISLAIFSAFSPKSHWLSIPSSTQAQPESRTSGPELGYERTNISHILFGIGASIATWRERSRSTNLWWDPKSTRGFVWLDAKPDNQTSNVSGSIPYRVSEDWTRFKYSSSQSAVRIARIVYESFKLRVPNVRWFVMGDDDTVFFTHNLVSVLARYDHNQMYYIGGNSESVEQDVMHAYEMAFGGGGFAISYQLAARLVERMDGCLERYYNFYGSDQRVWGCVSEMGVPLTKLRGFHQFDIRGDAYGILAAHPLAPLVSLHHLDTLKPLFPNQTHLDSVKSLLRAYRVDPGRILQQSFCYDHRRKWSMSISWGYTIQLYPSMVAALDLQIPLRTFKTWRSWNDGPFTFNTRPMSSVPCEQPLIFFLDHVKVSKSGLTVTTYKRFVANGGQQCDKEEYIHARAMQKIIVSSNKMDPQYWTKEEAPRRECSEIKNRDGFWHVNMEIRIRACRPSESIFV